MAPLDSVTTNRFDDVYYRNLVNNSRLLRSNQAFMADNITVSMVILYSRFPNLLSMTFRASMMKMSYISVLAGKYGEIRKNCRMVN